MSRKATYGCGVCQKCKRRVYMRDWYRLNQENVIARVKRYRVRNIERVREYDRKRGYRNPQEQTAAHNAVRHALEKGELRRTPCELCGREPGLIRGREILEAHHEDYSRPLSVRWLCRDCHRAQHRKIA